MEHEGYYSLFVHGNVQWYVEVAYEICDALRDLVLFVQFKKVKNTHRGGVLLLVK